MIATEVGGERYRLVFEHIDDWPRETEARLERHRDEKWVILQAGLAKCSVDDPYVRETGRRIALKRLYRKACPQTQPAGSRSESTNAKAMRRLMRAYFDRPRGRQ